MDPSGSKWKDWTLVKGSRSIKFGVGLSSSCKKRSLDYYLYSVGKLLVVEAKNADLARGFTQLAVELIALDQWTNSDQSTLQGAVSTGDIWQFGLLSREQKQIQQGLTLYRVPDDLESLIRILIKILDP